MASSESVPLVLDSFPLPPVHNHSAAIIQAPEPTVSASPPQSVEQYQAKKLPPLPPTFNVPTWGTRPDSLMPAPLSLPIKSSRSITPGPSSPHSPRPLSLTAQRPATACDSTRISVIANQIMEMAWVGPTTSIQETYLSTTPSLTDTSRGTSFDSGRPDSPHQYIAAVENPVPFTPRTPMAQPVRVVIASDSLPILSPQPRKSSNIMALTESNSVFTNSPGFLPPTGHNSASKINRLLGIDPHTYGPAPASSSKASRLLGVEVNMSDLALISPVSSNWTGAADPVSAPISEPDTDQSYTWHALDTRSDHEAWMGPSPQLPPLEVPGSLGFSAENFKVPAPLCEERPRALKFAEPHPVRDLYHSRALEVSQDMPLSSKNSDKMETTVIQVGKGKKRAMAKSPAQYSFFPRKASFSVRSQGNATQGNRKLPPTPLMPKPSFVKGKHPMKTPFPDQTSFPSTEYTTAGLNTAGLSTAGLPTGSTPHPTSPLGENEVAYINEVNDIYHPQAISAFDMDDEEPKSRSFLSEKRISVFTHVFKRHPSTTSKEDKRKSKDSFASIGGHSFFRSPPRHISSTPPQAVITTTIGTPERAFSFTSEESSGRLSNYLGGVSTANTTPVSASATRFLNPFSRSSTPVDVYEDMSFNEKMKMKSLQLGRSLSTKKNVEAVERPKSTRVENKNAEMGRDSTSNKIRIMPNEDMVEAGVPASMNPMDIKKASKRLSGHITWFK